VSRPKVSVVVPIYNAQKYLRQCLDSLVNQTLRQIEIICVNDGSVDQSLQIIRQYASQDPRIRVIDKPNTGYGHSLNCGLDAAQGEYLGIVESDDYARPDMFERLYRCAASEDLDVAKAGFYFYYSASGKRSIPFRIAARADCGRVLCPLTDLKTPQQQVDFFNNKPSIWSAIYKITFLRENGIRVNETPGASYQDTSFNFQVWACAGRLSLLRECLLYYRQDNEASSVNAPGKIYCVCDEYAQTDRFLQDRPQLLEKLAQLRSRLMYETYLWNYDRLDERFRQEFLQRAASDFAEQMQKGYLDRRYFPAYKWGAMQFIIRDPQGYHRWRCKEAVEIPEDISVDLKESVGQKVLRKLAGAYRTWKAHGFGYMLLYAAKLLRN